MSDEIENIKSAITDRLANHVFPLFIMNLGGMGLPDDAIKLIINALMDAFKEDNEILKEI